MRIGWLTCFCYYEVALFLKLYQLLFTNCRNLFPLERPICAEGAHLDKPTVYKRNYLGRQAVYIENKYLFDQEQSLI